MTLIMVKTNPTKMSITEKLDLLQRAFQTTEGTLAVYRASSIKPPAKLAATVGDRIRDFHEATRTDGRQQAR